MISDLKIMMRLFGCLALIFCCVGNIYAQPQTSNVVLNATSFNNSTDDDLGVSYDLSGEADAVRTAVAWYIDGNPMMEFYLPFEGDIISSQLDFSGNSHTVTVTGSPVWDPSGGPNSSGAYQFNSTNRFEAEVFPTYSSYTKVAWVLMTDYNSSHNILSSQEITDGHTFWASQTQDNKLSAGQAGIWAIVQDSDSLKLNQWYFVAVTFDYATGEMILYKDDQVVDAATVAEDQLDITDATLQVGTFANGSGWKGRIAEARVYNYVVSPEQILALYNGPDSIRSTETTDGEVWQAEVTPFSSTEMGSSVLSNTLTIGLPDVAVSSVDLNSTSGYDLTIDDLDVTYSLEGDASTAAMAWYKDDSPIMDLYMVFEGGPDNAILDLSGNGNTISPSGVVSASDAWDAAAGRNASGAFEYGNSSNQFYLDAGAIMPTSSSYSKFCWIYKTANDGSLNILSGSVWGADNGGHVLFASSSQDYELAAGHNGTANFVRNIGNPLLIDTWYHVGVTFDYTTGEMILYQDGLQVDIDTLPMDDRDVTDAQLLIGSLTSSSGNQWSGYIDNVRILDHAETPAQIEELYLSEGSVIRSQETDIGDQWRVDVTPFSSNSIGMTVSSNTLTILPSYLEAPLLLDPCIDDSVIFNLCPCLQCSAPINPFGGQLYFRLHLNMIFDQYYYDSLLTPIFTIPDTIGLDVNDNFCWDVTAWVDTGGAVVEATSAMRCHRTWLPGDVNLDKATNIADLVALVDYTFKGGSIADPILADVDGDCEKNVADLVYYVDYMFKGGPPPQTPTGCPQVCPTP